MSWTGSMLSAGSPPASTPCAATSNAGKTKQARCSTTTCSEPGSYSCGAPTGSPPTRPNASNNSWSGIPACGRPGTPWPSSTASTSPRGLPSRPRRPAALRRPLRRRGASRVRRCHGNRQRLGKRNPRLASDRTTLQRPPRRNQQPPPGTTANRPRIHQPLQLRSPRTPTNLTTTPTTPPHPKSHTFAKGQKIPPDPPQGY